MGISHSTAMRDSAVLYSEDYTIYTFKNCTHGSEKWNRDETTGDVSCALERAQSLFQTGDYCKVEIRKTLFDPKSGQTVDRSFKTWRYKQSWPSRLRAGAGLCAVAGILILAIGVLIGSR